MDSEKAWYWVYMMGQMKAYLMDVRKELSREYLMVEMMECRMVVWKAHSLENQKDKLTDSE